MGEADIAGVSIAVRHHLLANDVQPQVRQVLRLDLQLLALARGEAGKEVEPAHRVEEDITNDKRVALGQRNGRCDRRIHQAGLSSSGSGAGGVSATTCCTVALSTLNSVLRAASTSASLIPLRFSSAKRWRITCLRASAISVMVVSSG